METMHLDGMEFKDIEIDYNSFMPNKKMKLSDEEEDFDEHPLVISDAEDLIFYLEHNQDEFWLIMEMIRRATLEFSDYQKTIISKMEQEYIAWCSSNETRDSEQFENYVIELKEDMLVEPIFNPQFCEEQRLSYSYIHKIFEKSSFPYSEKQLKLMEVIKHDLEFATGNIRNHCDEVVLDEFQDFLNLMKSRDHINCPKFYVEATVEYYVQEIVDELFYAVSDESRRIIPEHFAEEPMINLATYVTKELQSAYTGVRYEIHEDLFHLGLSEVYYRLIDIFKLSGILTDHQQGLLTDTFKEIRIVETNRRSSSYEDLHLGFYGFMDAIRRNHRDRETKEEMGYIVIDEEGPIAKKVQKIVKDLMDVEDVEKIHVESFSYFASPIPELTNKLLRHFRRIYPEIVAEPILVELHL